ncbi:hypothetical protein BJV74DRAFT_337672 [Russula compacta]|nr:hypothetical protein BJV74DRAFT_337672 [Russula compacta]
MNFGIPGYTHNSQVNSECDLTTYTNDLSGAMGWPALPWSHLPAYAPYTPLKSTVQGPERFGSTPVVLNEGPAHFATTIANTTADFLESETVFHTPGVVQSQEQRVSGDSSQRLQKTGKGPAAGPSRTSRRGDARGAPKPKGSYLCIVQGCDNKYKQSQGLWLHYREKHAPNLCPYCGVFKWARPYRYKEHLEKEHSGVDPEAALDEATWARRSAKITSGYSRRQQFFPSTPEHDRWGHAGTQSSSTFPPTVSLADCSLKPDLSARSAQTSLISDLNAVNLLW